MRRSIWMKVSKETWEFPISVSIRLEGIRKIFEKNLFITLKGRAMFKRSPKGVIDKFMSGYEITPDDVDIVKIEQVSLWKYDGKNINFKKNLSEEFSRMERENTIFDFMVFITEDSEIEYAVMEKLFEFLQRNLDVITGYIDEEDLI